MPTFSCNKAVKCPGSDNPLGNFSSEDPDSAFRIGYSTGTAPTSSFRKRGGTGPISNSDNPSGDPEVGEETADTGTGGNPPPIGSEFDNLTVTTFTEIIDDDDPDTDPGNVNIDQLVDTDDPGAGGWKLRPTRTTPTIFVNQPQTCIVNCPDGSPFEFTVPVGRFRALSQEAANRAAYSYACKQAQRNLLCIGAASTTGGCVGVAYSATIPAYGLNRPIIFEVISGVIPSWMTLFQTSATVFLTGTPSSPDVGSSTFTIQATDSRGFTMTRVFTVTVMDFTSNTELPPFIKGTPYSQTITVAGGVAPYEFRIFSGDLPPGLSLSTDGIISGTPTVNSALFPVIIAFRDAEGHVCQDTFSFSDACVTDVTPAVAATYTLSSPQVCYASIPNKVFATDGLNVLVRNGDTLVAETFFSASGDISLLFYEATNNRVYVGYVITVGPDQQPRLKVVNASTYAEIDDFALASPSVSDAPPKYATYDPTRNKLWVSDAGSSIYAINAATFSVNAINLNDTPTTPPVSGIVGIEYCSESDLIAVGGGLFDMAPFGALLTIHPSVGSYINVFNTGTDFNNAICYASVNDRIYISNGDTGLIKVNPSNGSSTVLPYVEPFSAACQFNPCTNRVVVVSGFNSPVIARYYKTLDDSLVASVNSGVNFVAGTYPGKLVYDSNHAKMLFAAGATVIAFT